MFYALGGSKTLVTRTLFIMILTWDIQTHWQAPKQNKKTQTIRCTKHRQAPKNKSSNYSEVAVDPYSSCFFCCFCIFGACAGLVHLVVCCFFGACAGLVTLTSQSIDKQQKQSRNTANILSNLLSLLLHLLLISPWWISIAAASWLQARSYIFGFQKPLQ